MQIVINIPEHAYEECKAVEFSEALEGVPFHVMKAIANGTPIRKGHWVENAPQYDMLNPQYICSECGNAHSRKTPYCEICGSDMR